MSDVRVFCLLLDTAGVRPNAWDMAAVVKTGHKDAMRLLLKRGCPVMDHDSKAPVADAAFGTGDLRVCRWLHRKTPRRLQKEGAFTGLQQAAERGKARIVEQLLGLPRGAGAEPTPGWAEKAYKVPVVAAGRGGKVAFMKRMLQLHMDDPERWQLSSDAPRDLPAGAAYGCDLATLKRVLAGKYLRPLEVCEVLTLSALHAAR
jgi:hypothetical protein